jgi:NAD(P)H-hydrate epimerase
MHVSPELPIVTASQMAAVDRAMVEVCGLELVQVMETACRAVAVAVRHVQPQGSIAILCGSGGNGGDGFVCVRYLAGWGYAVHCVLAKPASKLSGLAAHQLQICRKLGISVIDSTGGMDFSAVDLIVDGVFGFGLNAAPSGRAAQLIEAANNAAVPILAIDIPSGVDSTSGGASAASIVAGVTVTLGLPKQGLLTGDGPAHAGTVIVADIGIPAAAYASVGIPRTSVFDRAEFVTLDGRPWPS